MNPETQLNDLKTKEAKMTDTLMSSPTSFGGEEDPTTSDTSAQTRINRIRGQITKANDKIQRDKWYGPDGQSDKETDNTGIIGRVLDTLATPLRGVVGAAEYATGKNVAPTLAGNINENISTGHRTFGDLLKRENVPWVVSAPVGFALDVALDPVNWATAGTAALVPRIASGLVAGTKVGGIKSGLQAAVKGAASSGTGSFLARRASNLASLPFMEKTGLVDSMRALPGKAAEASTAYDALTGRDFLKNVVPNGGFGYGSEYRYKLGDLLKTATEKLPGGKALFENFNYSNKEWMRLAKLKDSLQQKLGMTDEFNASVRAYINGEDPAPYIEQARKRISEMAASEDVVRTVGDLHNIDTSNPINISSGGGIDNMYQELMNSIHGGDFSDSAESIVKGADEAVDILKNPTLGTTSDVVENANRLTADHFNDTLSAVSMADLKKLVNTSMGETGVKWYDDMEAGIRNLKKTVTTKDGEEKVYNYGAKTLEGYKFFNNIFKRAKIGASPTAWTNAILGNPTMAWMAGVDVFSPQYMGRIKDAFGAVRGAKGSDEAIQKMLNFGEMRRFMEESPTTFTRSFGESPKYFQTRAALNTVMRKGKEAGLLGKDADSGQIAELLNSVGADLSQEMQTIIQEMGKSSEAASTIGKIAADTKTPGVSTPFASVKDLLTKGDPLRNSDLPTSLASNELHDSQMADKVLAYIQKKADEGNPGYKLLNLTFNKATNAYEGIDQTYKLGTTMYATMDGLTEKELNMVRRVLDFTPEDIAKMVKVNDNGTWRYRIGADKATELANEIFLNYNAMPGAVKVMRNFPIVGSPFFSFTYGMAAKTINTAFTNPAVFNKVNFALNDYGGLESPLQKRALNEPYYQNRKDPAMFNLPFFQENPIYMNMGNVLPYYSLNYFNQSKRGYPNEWFSDRFIKSVDTVGLFSNPIGSMLMDNFIQPLIIRDATQPPLGSFGQPIYPYGNVSTLAKAGYASRGLVEAITPGVANFLGNATPESAAEYMPGYRWRQLARAKEGENVYGISGKEPALSRVVRGNLANLGISLQSPMNLNFTPKKTKNINNNQ